MPVFDKLDKLMHPKKHTAGEQQASADAPPVEGQAPQPTAAEFSGAQAVPAPAVEATPAVAAAPGGETTPKRRQSVVDKLEEQVDKLLHRRSSGAEGKEAEQQPKKEGEHKFHWPHLGKEEKKKTEEEPAAVSA
ncbi:hypothetical protein LTS15_007981 [Exophiala xenobiotica]|nr:hypothetical protein LTS15_007981 [Exophiala xenobiotica]